MEGFRNSTLELHPEKTRTISFGKYEEENAKRQARKPNTFDFLGFTHYCGKGRNSGKFMVGRKTSRKKFCMKCKEMNLWLKGTRNSGNLKDWWPILRAKLRGHYQYYGISGNMREMYKYYSLTEKMILKWLNRRSQRKSFDWKRFKEYIDRYPLPKPRVVHNLYILSPIV